MECMHEGCTCMGGARRVLQRALSDQEIIEKMACQCVTRVAVTAGGLT